MSSETFCDILSFASIILIPAGFMAAAFARTYLAAAAGLLVVVAGFGAFIAAAESGQDLRATYQQRVSAALSEEYGATVTASSRNLLPVVDNGRSAEPVTVTVGQMHKSCTVETGDGPGTVIAICDGAELPRR